MANIENPVTIKAGGSLGDDVTTHPSFCQIGASRVSGGAFLYGSDFSHLNYITISIHTSDLRRGHSRDWHMAGNELIQVAISEAQWATFVSSMNIGCGVPCTLQRHGGRSIPRLPKPEALNDKFKAEMKETMSEIQKDMASLVEEVGSLGLGKGKAEALKKRLSLMHDRLTGNTVFVAKQFGEHVEHIVESAKVEINAYVVNQVTRAGLDALDAPISLLGQNSEDHNG